MNSKLKIRMGILDGAIDKLNVFEPGTQQSMKVVVLQERLRLRVLEWKLEMLEQGIEL